jgi:prepilin-type N-terminal cleavage/methylation domain-containing protein
MKLKTNKKGFTLVELLLVIAIIGILAAVLFVSLGKQRERARITTFKENMRGLVTTFTACADGGGTLPNGSTDSITEACSGGPSGIGDMPPIEDCDGDGYVTINPNDDAGDTWGFQSTCTTTGTDDCVAYCTPDGCQFCSSSDSITWSDGYQYSGDCDPSACQ